MKTVILFLASSLLAVATAETTKIPESTEKLTHEEAWKLQTGLGPNEVEP